MMKKMLSIAAALLLTVSLLAGCTTAQSELWNAYKKSGEVTYSAYEMSLGITTDASQVSDEEMLTALSFLKDVKVDIKGKSFADREKGIMKAEALTTANVMGISYPVNFWVDMNLSDPEKPIFRMIYELPQLFSMAVGNTAKYYFLDMTESMALSGGDAPDLAGLAGLMDPAQIFAAIEKIDAKGMEVSKKDDVYTLSFDDETLVSLLTQYMDILMEIPGYSALLEGAAPGAGFTPDFSEALDSLLKLGLFGDEKITTEIKLDQNGYFSETSTKLPIVIDSVKIGEVMGVPAPETKDKFTFNTTWDVKYTDYNTPTEIVFPALTPENSANLLDLMSAGAIPETDGVTVLVNGEVVEFDVQPVLTEGRTMVPARMILESLGASVDYAGDTRTVTAVLGDTSISHVIGEDIIWVNGEAQQMDVVSYETGGRTLVPARFIAQAFGATVEWVPEGQLVIIEL